MKEYLEKYREFKTNRRNVGLVKLGFWALFFGIVFILYMIPSKKSNRVYEPKKIDDKINNYYLELKDNDTLYKGYYSEDAIELVGDDFSFYITTDSILSDKENAIVPNYEYLDINVINELIESSTLESTTSYKDGKEEYKYTNEDNDKKIAITYIKYPDESILVSLVIDDTNIEIKYYDFNKASVSIDQDKYIYKIEVENEY